VVRQSYSHALLAINVNFRNLSMDELADVIINEPDQDRFNDAAKEFVRKFFANESYSMDELQAKCEEASDTAEELMQNQCRKEAQEILERYSGEFTPDSYEELRQELSLIG